jgi:hypothetical protein
VLRTGETYDRVIEDNLRNAAIVVVLWSPRSVASSWVRAEATIGQRKGALLPVVIEACERPLAFELVQTADLAGWGGDRADPRWADFIADVRAALSTRQQQERAHTAPPPPDPLTIETLYWSSIKDNGAPADFEAYIARYPHGQFVEIARGRIRATTQTAAVDMTPRLFATRPDDPPWQTSVRVRPRLFAARPDNDPPNSKATAKRDQERSSAGQTNIRTYALLGGWTVVGFAQLFHPDLLDARTSDFVFGALLMVPQFVGYVLLARPPILRAVVTSLALTGAWFALYYFTAEHVSWWQGLTILVGGLGMMGLRERTTETKS